MRDIFTGLTISLPILLNFLQAADKKKSKKLSHEVRLIIVVIVLFCILVTTIVAVYCVYESTGFRVKLGKSISIDLESRILKVYNSHHQVVLSGIIGKNIPTHRLPLDCSRDSSSPICLQWKGIATLTVDQLSNDPVSCYQFSWRQDSSFTLLSDCFDLVPFHWYGMGFFNDQKWPLERASLRNQRLMLGNQFVEGDLCQLLSYHWLVSSGVKLNAYSVLSMNVSINASNSQNVTDQQLCLSVDSKNYRSLFVAASLVDMVYNVCVADSVISVEKDAISSMKFADYPLSRPGEFNFRAPIWSTFGKFDININQNNILKFARDIIDYKYSHSLMLINEGWEREVGDLEFDPRRFSSPSNMTYTLIKQGFSLSLEVTPLISAMSETLHEAMTVSTYLVRDASQRVPGLVRWRRSLNLVGTIGAVIDITHEDAKAWFQGKLQVLKDKYTLFSFRFVAGESSYLPFLSSFGGELHDPNQFATHYANLASQMGPNNHICAGFESQAFGGLLCQQELNGTWVNLRKVIPSMLTASILGYPFVVPDPVGGTHNQGLPSEELYIRWMQVMSFFPIMHFSIPPHDYRKDVVAHALKLIARHESVVLPRVLHYLNFSERYDPLVQPLWWIAPNDAVALEIDDEFVVAGDLLVTPVLESNSRMRDVYIPSGSWYDVLKDVKIIGPTWIRSYSVALWEVPYFEKVIE